MQIKANNKKSLSSSEILEKLLIYLKLSPNKLAKELGLSSNVSVYNIKNGKYNISPRFAKRVVDEFPEINYEWLINGSGSITGNETEDVKSESQTKANGLSERFFLVIENLGYTIHKIAEEVDGISVEVLNRIINGRDNPDVKVINALLEKFPKINANWLLTGKGQMILKEEKEATSKDLDDILRKRIEFLFKKEIDEVIKPFFKLRDENYNGLYNMIVELQEEVRELQELRIKKMA